MPRDGSGIYSKPFPDVVGDTTIESVVYNGFVADVEQDLNAPRPISSGGTGATSPDTALIALGAEKGKQVVANYDSHAWVPGSFLSNTGATAAPPSGGTATELFVGTVLMHTATSGVTANITLEAYSTSTGFRYTRQKVAGTWGSWSIGDKSAVAKTGGTMTGPLSIETEDPVGFVITNSADDLTADPDVLYDTHYMIGTFQDPSGYAEISTEGYGDGGVGGGASYTYGRGTKEAPLVVEIDDEVGAHYFYFRDTTDFRYSAETAAVVDGAPTAAGTPTALVFRTSADSAPVERVRIPSSGGMLVNGVTTFEYGVVGVDEDITATLFVKGGACRLEKAGGYIESALPGTTGAVAWDVFAKPVATVTLTGDVTLSVTGAVTGHVYTLRVKQAAAANKAVLWTAANFKFVDGDAPAITATENAVDRFTFIASSATVLEEIGRAQDIG